MENSSLSRTSPDWPIAFGPDAFRPGSTVATAVGGIVIFLAVFVVGVIIWFVGGGLDIAGLQGSLAGLFGIALQSAAEVVLVLYLLIVLPPISRTTLPNLGLRLPNLRDAGKIILAIVVMFVLVTALGSILGTTLHLKIQELAVQVYLHMRGWQKVLFAFFAIVIGPVTEEFVFRVFLFNAMRKWWGFWPGAVVSSLLFGLAHAQQPFTATMLLALSLPLAVGGMVLCVIYARTGSTLSNMITHAAFNGLTLLLITVAPQLAK